MVCKIENSDLNGDVLAGNSEGCGVIKVLLASVWGWGPA